VNGVLYGICRTGKTASTFKRTNCVRKKEGQRGIILTGMLWKWHKRVWAGFVFQRGTELQSKRYGEYFDQLMVFSLFEQELVSWIHLRPNSQLLIIFCPVSVDVL
jgi:hypothetical protein